MVSDMPRRRASARDLALIATFAALIAVLGLPGTLTVLGTAVPITLQTLGVMLAGSLLGPRRGALAVVVFLALTAAGLPLLAGGRGGLAAVFVGPGAGYRIGWILGAFVIGAMVSRRLPSYPVWWGALANVVGGILVIYAIGIPVMAYVTGTSLTAAAVAGAVFLPGDAIKVVIATTVAAAVHRAVPDLAPSKPRVRAGV